ncbi:MAG: hypothetical protein LVQ64_00205 [Thermoplasmatales archaeon]|nr:hypothetical protein [Thermoplasmatales archaeon]
MGTMVSYRATRRVPASTLMTGGATLAFLGFLVAVISAVLVNALAESAPATSDQILYALYAGVAIIVVGLILLLAGVWRD